MSAYESQVAYTTIGSFEKTQRMSAIRRAENARKIAENERKFEAEMAKKTAMKNTKKGFFRRILDWFRNDKSVQDVAPKPTIASVKVAPKPTRYSQKTTEVKKNTVESDFAKALRNMENYSKENHCVTYKNGRKRNYEPRYL